MKLSIRIPLLIGVVVLITTASIIIPMQIRMGNKIMASFFEELEIRAEANTELIKTRLENRLDQLWEIANRARTRTMDWDGAVRSSLLPVIPRLGVLELMVIYPDGTNHYVTDDSRASPPLREYSLAAFAGRTAV